MKRHLCLVLPLVLIFPAFLQGADGTEYPVRLERAYHVGDKTKVEAVGAIKETIVRRVAGDDMPGRTDETIGIRLDGVSEVKTVDENGRRTEVRFTIAACTVMTGDKSRQLLPKGKVIYIRWNDDKTHYFVDGDDATDEYGDLLDLAVELSDPASVSDDKIFRTETDKHRVNDSWAIDAASALKEFERVGLKCKEEELWGETTLKSAEKADGVETVALQVRFKASNLAGPGRKPEKNVKIVKATIDSDAKVVLPVDPAAQAVKEEGKIKTSSEVQAKTEDGKAVQMSRSTERVFERVMTPMK